jgi:hypothetical protein
MEIRRECRAIVADGRDVGHDDVQALYVAMDGDTLSDDVHLRALVPAVWRPTERGARARGAAAG